MTGIESKKAYFIFTVTILFQNLITPHRYMLDSRCDHKIASRSRIHSFFYKNVVFPARAEYSYFSADFRFKIFLYYS